MDKSLMIALAKGTSVRHNGNAGIMGNALNRLKIAENIMEIMQEHKGQYMRVTDIYKILDDRATQKEEYPPSAQRISNILNTLEAAGEVRKYTATKATVLIPDGRVETVKVKISYFYL